MYHKMDRNVSTKCKWTQNAGKTHIFLEMRAAVCYSRDIDIYSQNTSLTNSCIRKQIVCSLLTQYTLCRQQN